MWAVYTYSSAVAARKCVGGTWQTAAVLMTGGGQATNSEIAPPSAVVDGKGVVHVVWGTGRMKSQTTIPQMNYARNNTGATTFTAAADIDPWIPADVGDVYPTVSLDTSNGDVYALWVRTDTSVIGRTVMARKLAGGTWSNVTLEAQTSYPKQYLTSVYSISGEFMVCWQWTQNTTGTIQVMFDHRVPEFSEIALPIVFTMGLIAVWRAGARRKNN